MIEVRELDQRGTLADAEVTLVELTRLDGRLLTLAGHWADLHAPDSLPAPVDAWEAGRRRLNSDYGIRPGGEGTPEILASCPAELGLVLQTSAGGAKHLIADALDLRHRLPQLWAEVQDGRVRAWKARKVAQATRHLPFAAAREVDAGLAGLIPTLPWTRFATILDATLMRADPIGARLREAEAASRRFVALGHDGGPGLKTLIARGEVLDILTFLAAVNRVADLLAAEGDADTVEVRRSKAVGILGQPDRALTLLSTHQHDDDQPPIPVEPRQQGGWRRAGGSDADGYTEDRDPGEPGPAPVVDLRGGDQRPAPRDEGDPDQDAEAGCDTVEGAPGGRSLDLAHPVPTTSGTSSTSSTAQVRVQLYVHLTDAALAGTDPTAVCRVEGVGPVTATTVRSWLQRPGVRITVRPVVVPGDAIPVDGYEIPHRVREAVLLRNPASAFPWSSCTDRTSLQLDHVVSYLARCRGGPPRQTDPRKLAPLVQPEHQRKTSGSWRERTPAPGVYLWRSPRGWVSLVTNQGTYPLGAGTTADAFWRAAGPRGHGTAEATGQVA